MASKGTESESRVVNELIKRYENRHRTWPRNRWAIVVVSLFSIGVAVVAFVSLARIRGVQRDDLLRTAEPSAVQEEILDYVDARARLLSAEIKAVLVMTVSGVVGLATLLITLAQWNDHMHRALMARVLRERLTGSAGPADLT